MPNCTQCNQDFELTEADKAFYKKIEVPFPKLCPKDRLKRRLAFRNERKLFRRKCDGTGEMIISNIRPNTSFPVFHNDFWQGDQWQAKSLDYNPSKSLFSQLKDLSKIAAIPHKASGGNETNSEYTNHAGYCKNCYFIFNSEYDEDCMYMRFADGCSDCLDCSNLIKSELCYECVNVEGSYNIRYSDDCKNCQNSHFLRFCRSTQDSIFCYGLDNKKYHIFNEPHTKEEYEVKLAALKLHTIEGIKAAKEKWNEWSKQFPLMREVLLNCENCTGSSLFNCKNAKDCYTCLDMEDCRYCLNSAKVKDSYDFYAYGEVELCYEYVTGFKSYNILFSSHVINCTNIEYSHALLNCKDCFACWGLKGKSFCILNKEYSEEEYTALVAEIKEKMLEDGEYGEFMPIELSPYQYEDTIAQDYFPQPEKHKEQLPGDYLEVSSMPNDINEANLEELQKQTFACPETKKPFRLQKQELEFYKRQNLPLPQKCFEARYLERNKLIPFPY